MVTGTSHSNTDPGCGRTTNRDMALSCRGASFLKITCLKNRTRKEEEFRVLFCTGPWWRWSRLILTVSQRNKWYYTHFIGKETEGWGGGYNKIHKFLWLTNFRFRSLALNLRPLAYLWEHPRLCTESVREELLLPAGCPAPGTGRGRGNLTPELSSGTHDMPWHAHLTYIMHIYIQ